MFFVAIKIRSYCEGSGNSFLIIKTTRKVNTNTMINAEARYNSKRPNDSRGRMIF